MARLTAIFAAICILYPLPFSLAWTFVWRNATDIPTVESGTDAQSCKTIEQARNKNYTFDAEESIVRIYLYGSSNCTGDIIEASEDKLANNSTVPVYGFAVINLKGASRNSTDLTPFPGNYWFKTLPNSPVITAMGKRLVAEGCGKYKEGPGPQWSDADRQSYQCWQEKQGFTGESADGWPGEQTWDQLKVPLTVTGDSDSSSTEATTPSSTNAGTSNPTGTSASSTDTPSKPSLSGGEIGGIVVGSVIGVGLIGAIIYLSRRIGRRGFLASGDTQPQPQPKGGGVSVESQVQDAQKPKVEHLPSEDTTVFAKQNRPFAELSGDVVATELSNNRAILELGDGQKQK